MMTEEKAERFERMSAIAERIVSRCTVEPPRFSEQSEAWMPVARQMYDNEEFRASLLERAVTCWRGVARSHLFNATLLLGPKGKLPA